MQRITGAIEGVAPLLFSRFYKNPEGINPKPSDDDKAQEAHNRCHRDESGCYIPAGMFKQAILAGAKVGAIKRGRANYAPFLEATLFCAGHLYLGKQEYDREFSHWGRVPPVKGAAVILRYPQFDTGWKASFSLMLTIDDSNAVQAIRNSLDASGLLVGLGSWRPEFGRFVVTEFQP